MTRMLLAAVLTLTLAGCGLTPQSDAVRGAVAERGRAAAAAGLENAEWYICRASPVGAVVDRYGAAQAQWDAWSQLCLNRAAAAGGAPGAAAPGGFPGPISAPIALE